MSFRKVVTISLRDLLAKQAEDWEAGASVFGDLFFPYLFQKADLE